MSWLHRHRPSGHRSTAGTRSGVRVGSFDWSVPTADLGVPVELAFEHLLLLAPADAHAVLTRIYGDCGELPAEADRVSEHAFTARRRSADPSPALPGCPTIR